MSWGKCTISVDSNLELPYTTIVLNPFRYRSYYYDIETGLIYGLVNMNNIIWIVSTIIIINLLGIILKELYSKDKANSKSNILRPKKILLISGSLCSIGSLLLVIVAWFLDTNSTMTEKYLYASLIIVLAILLGGYLICFYLNYKIILYEDYFIYQNFFRIKKIIYYKDVIINKTKLYPQIKINKKSGKEKTIFKMAGLLENENRFMEYYRNWKK